MQEQPAWLYNEYQHVGVDYGSLHEVEAYDQRMRAVREFERETDEILEALGLAPGALLLELGAGTGEFAIGAAKRGYRVIAADISELMLDCARAKAQRQGVPLEFALGGFLTYEHRGEPADAIVSQLALHHLPDFWKGVALRRLCAMLKPGGRLFLRDVVFSFCPEQMAEAIEGWAGQVRRQSGEDFAQKVYNHIRNEHSTEAWIMEGLLKGAGLAIVRAEYASPMMAAYLCQQVG